MNENLRRRRTDKLRMAPIVWAFVCLTFIFFGTLAGFAYVINGLNDNSHQLRILVHENQRLVKENENRINDIQQARIESCAKTYSSVGEVFKPFFPKPPLTPAQKERLDTFNETIRILRAGCARQTGQE